MFLFLVIIYMAYTLHGMPYNVISSVWVDIAKDISADVVQVGFVTCANNLSFLSASILAPLFQKRIGTGKTLSFAVFCFAVAMGIVLFAGNLLHIIMAAVLIGFGNGLIDPTANHFVVKNFKAKNVLWLHACWGIGSFISIFFLSSIIKYGYSYKLGVKILLLIFVIASTISFAVRTWWGLKNKREKRVDTTSTIKKDNKKSLIYYKESLIMKNAFNYYSIRILIQAMQNVTQAFVSTYCVIEKCRSVAEGAFSVSVFLGGLTIGRIGSGFLTDKYGDEVILKTSMVINAIGLVMLFVSPNDNIFLIFTSIFLMGLGSSTVNPLIVHFAKDMFPAEKMSYILSINAAVGNVSAVVFSLIVTYVVKITSMSSFVICVLLLNLTMIFMFCRLCKKKSEM